MGDSFLAPICPLPTLLICVSQQIRPELLGKKVYGIFACDNFYLFENKKFKKYFFYFLSDSIFIYYFFNVNRKS